MLFQIHKHAPAHVPISQCIVVYNSYIYIKTFKAKNIDAAQIKTFLFIFY